MTHGNTGDFQARMTFPLFVGGERQLQRKWVGNGTLPDGMGDQYTYEQLELLCVSEVRSASLCTALKKRPVSFLSVLIDAKTQQLFRLDSCALFFSALAARLFFSASCAGFPSLHSTLSRSTLSCVHGTDLSR